MDDIGIPEDYLVGIEDEWFPIGEAIRLLSATTGVEFPYDRLYIYLRRKGLIKDGTVRLLDLFLWFNRTIRDFKMPKGYRKYNDLLNSTKGPPARTIKKWVSQGRIRRERIDFATASFYIYNVQDLEDQIERARQRHKRPMRRKWQRVKEIEWLKRRTKK